MDLNVSYINTSYASSLLLENHFYPSPHRSLGHTETRSFIPSKYIIIQAFGNLRLGVFVFLWKVGNIVDLPVTSFNFHLKYYITKVTICPGLTQKALACSCCAGIINSAYFYLQSVPV